MVERPCVSRRYDPIFQSEKEEARRPFLITKQAQGEGNKNDTCQNAFSVICLENGWKKNIFNFDIKFILCLMTGSSVAKMARLILDVASSKREFFV